MPFVRVIKRYIDENTDEEILICETVVRIVEGMFDRLKPHKTQYQYRFVNEGKTYLKSELFDLEQECSRMAFDHHKCM